MRVLLLVLTLSSFLCAEVLKISFSRSSEEPYVFIEKRKLRGGVLKELMDAISKQSGIKMKYVLVSKRNQEKEIDSGVIDGACLINPEEFSNAKDYQWSNSLYKEEDVLIVRVEDEQKLQSIKSLYGHSVGTISSHSYPHLDPFFENETIKRVNNKKLSNSITQLKFGVVDAVVDTKLAVGHCIQKKELEGKFSISNKVIDTQELHCAFRKDTKISLNKINSALATLKSKGVIDKILNKYRASL